MVSDQHFSPADESYAPAAWGVLLFDRYERLPDQQMLLSAPKEMCTPDPSEMLFQRSEVFSERSEVFSERPEMLSERPEIFIVSIGGAL